MCVLGGGVMLYGACVQINLWESVFPFHPVGSRDWTQVISLKTSTLPTKHAWHVLSSQQMEAIDMFPRGDKNYYTREQNKGDFMLYSKHTIDMKGAVGTDSVEGEALLNCPEHPEGRPTPSLFPAPSREKPSPISNLGMAWPVSCNFRKVSSYCGSSTYVISHCITSSTVQLYTVERQRKTLFPKFLWFSCHSSPNDPHLRIPFESERWQCWGDL